MKEDIDKKEEYDWFKENAERGAFALTQEELDFYFNKDRYANIKSMFYGKSK